MAETNTNAQVAEPMTAPNAVTTTAQEPEKTFSQAEVDALIAKRLERERKKYPTDEELNTYKAWKESQQTEQEKWDNLTKERDGANKALETANAELEQLKREKYISGKGVPADDLEYYAFKIGKLVTEDKTFEQAADEFFKEKAPNKVRIDMTAPLSRGAVQFKTKEEIYSIKDPKERQKAIADNRELFGLNFD